MRSMYPPDHAPAVEKFGVGTDSAPARRTAANAARRAGVTVHNVSGITELRAASALFESVWGRTPEGVPAHSELLRSLVHAGGCVTAALGGSGRLLGAAALTVAAPPGTTYSLITAVTPGAGDRGIGYALKQHQRWWALDRGHHTMRWTFDPLVARNARFNLAKLGAEAHEYESAFYGRMADDINGADQADRLVATWALGSARAVSRAETGPVAEPDGPAARADPLALGPDRLPLLCRDGAGRWCRVPRDIVGLRHADPGAAANWRVAVREVMVRAFAEGLAATHVTRDGWYLLTPAGTR